MTTPIVERLEALLATGKETAMLRFSLGSEHLKVGAPAAAATHLRRAVELDPRYSAAWKLLGRALADTGAPAEALDAWDRGIAVAGAKGDVQAAKEMTVFAKRVRKQLEGGSPQ